MTNPVDDDEGEDEDEEASGSPSLPHLQADLVAHLFLRGPEDRQVRDRQVGQTCRQTCYMIPTDRQVRDTYRQTGY